MIKIEHQDVHGFIPAIRGMRNPMNSWDKSDSINCEDYDANCFGCPLAETDEAFEFCSTHNGPYPFTMGPEDFKLCKKLADAGSVHAKYRRMIVVYVDVTAPLYWWKEFDTYKVGTVANSCSTMHKITSKEFTVDDFSHEHLTDPILMDLENTVAMLNDLREWYLKYDSMQEKDRLEFASGIESKKDIWWQIIQTLPSSYNQKRTLMMNYEVLSNIYKYRKDHKLDEWRMFCDWIEKLPYSQLITGEKENDND